MDQRWMQVTLDYSERKGNLLDQSNDCWILIWNCLVCVTCEIDRRQSCIEWTDRPRWGQGCSVLEVQSLWGSGAGLHRIQWRDNPWAAPSWADLEAHSLGNIHANHELSIAEPPPPLQHASSGPIHISSHIHAPRPHKAPMVMDPSETMPHPLDIKLMSGGPPKAGDVTHVGATRIHSIGYGTGSECSRSGTPPHCFDNPMEAPSLCGPYVQGRPTMPPHLQKKCQTLLLGQLIV